MVSHGSPRLGEWDGRLAMSVMEAISGIYYFHAAFHIVV